MKEALVATPAQTIALATKVADTMKNRFNIESLVIGGHALAVHHYARTTTDLDLGIAIDPYQLALIDEEVKKLGPSYDTKLCMPDGDDPLGGVIDIVEVDTGANVQIVNFRNLASGIPIVIEEALQSSKIRTIPNSTLLVIPLPHLIALKIYEGDGEASKNDIRELLRNNPQANLEEIRALCSRYRLPLDSLD